MFTAFTVIFGVAVFLAFVLQIVMTIGQSRGLFWQKEKLFLSIFVGSVLLTSTVVFVFFDFWK